MKCTLTTQKQVRSPHSVDLGTLETGEAAVGVVSGALYIKMPGNKALQYTEDGFERVAFASGQHVLRVTSLRINATHE